MFSSSFKLEKQILDPEVKSKKRAVDLLGPSLRYFDEVIQISDAILKNRLNLRKKRLQKLRNEVVLILTTESEERIALEKNPKQQSFNTKKYPSKAMGCF